MAASSSEFPEINQYERSRRSRSGGYIDHLEEKTRWDRRDRERQTRRYRDEQPLLSPSSPRVSRAPDRLCVPIFDTATRRTRSSSDVDTRSGRRYHVQEVRPNPIYDSTLSSAPTLPSQLPDQYERKSQRHQKRPSIRVEIHQDNPPPSPSIFTPKRSPATSPTAHPHLHTQYVTLQNKLGQIPTLCTRYLDVEAANPQDLTFEKISSQAKGFAFDLQVWAHVANLEGMIRVEQGKKSIVEAASRTLERLGERVEELGRVCGKANPRDLKFVALPNVDEDMLFQDDDGEGDASDTDPTETIGFVISDCLHSIALQIQNLKRLTRCLREATLDARDEVLAVGRLVEEICQYCETQEVPEWYGVNEMFL